MRFTQSIFFQSFCKAVKVKLCIFFFLPINIIVDHLKIYIYKRHYDLDLNIKNHLNILLSVFQPFYGGVSRSVTFKCYSCRISAGNCEKPIFFHTKVTCLSFNLSFLKTPHLICFHIAAKLSDAFSWKIVCYKPMPQSVCQCVVS